MTLQLSFNRFSSFILIITIILFSAGEMIGQIKSNIVTIQVAQGEVEDNSQESPLPVELADFNGTSKGCTNILNWSTAVEVNTNYFEILQSSDGKQFNVIDAVNAAGTSTQFNHYNFSHSVNTERTYYQIRAVDIDGSIFLSDVVVVNAACKVLLDDLALYPNPTNHDIKLSFSTQKERNVQVEVLDGLGRTVVDKQMEVTSGFNSIDLETNELTPGIYHIKIHGDYFYRLKFIKIE